MCYNVQKLKKSGKYKEDSFKGKKGQEYYVDTWKKCGHCQECINEKANNWVIRNYYEAKAHDDKCFITLTYAKDPIVLIKKDIQDFLKRLRKRINPTKVRYFAVGEYGTLRGRPHYHAIIYGWKDDKATVWQINKKHQLVLRSKIIDECWRKGITSYQEFNNNEIPYIALYENINEDIHKEKTISKERFIEYYKKNKREYDRLFKKVKDIESAYIKVKEFNIWSIGLGFEKWLEDYETIKHTFTEYIDNKEFMTPTPWIIKMANIGDKYAIKEYEKRREYSIIAAETEDERKRKKEAKEHSEYLKKIIDLTKKYNVIEDSL